MSGRTWYANVNYVCNERCVFCASDLTNDPRLDASQRAVTLADVETWLTNDRPRPTDEIHLAGGEPTLHPKLPEIVELLSKDCSDVRMYTNGLRLSDQVRARRCVEAGINRFEIALYGSDEASHDAITRVKGSFVRTLKAISVLGELRREYDFELVARLLVSRHSAEHNPALIDVLVDQTNGVDVISMNRLILSDHASDSEAAISWADARPSINETIRRAMDQGWEVMVDAIPVCILDGDVQGELMGGLRERLALAMLPSGRDDLFYLDPMKDAAPAFPAPRVDGRADPDACQSCDVASICGRTESWYLDRFGDAGLAPLHLRMRTPA